MLNNLREIIIDTNIFLHANNPCNKCFESSEEFLNFVLENCNIKICVDIGKSDGSQILQEYLDHINLQAPGRGSFILSHILASKRYVGKNKHPQYENSKRRNDRKKKIIETNISNHEQVDRIFLGVTCNSRDKIFISDDFSDFHKRKRSILRAKLDIDIFCSNGMCFNSKDCVQKCKNWDKSRFFN